MLKKNKELVAELQNVLGLDFVIYDEEVIEGYIYDEIEMASRPIGNNNCILLKPQNAEEISKIVKIANRDRIAIVVRGGGTGLTGGCTPIKPSFIISMERLNKIIEIDDKNMVAVLEAGVTLMDLLEELKLYDGLSFPVHPGDEGAHMGGMAVTNAGGARAVRHGVMRKHILGLEVILPNGEIIEFGGKLVKNNAGYNLTQLLIGSEGTLGIVTKVILKIFPRDEYSATIIAPFESIADACNATIEILKSGAVPLAVEYMDKRVFVGTAEMLGLKWQAEKGNADLLIILSESTGEQLLHSVKKVNEICEKNNSYECLYAEKEKEQEELLRIRSQQYEYVKDELYDSFDMAVPVANVPELILGFRRLVDEYKTGTYIVAHIADGNVHNDIIYLEDGSVPLYAEELKKKMYGLCFSLGGTITGEHGVGKLRVEDLKLQKTETELRLMRGIKNLFDPNGIMNPGNIIEE